MNEKEMRARSAAKVKQITELMQVLHVRAEARERVDQTGFIDKVVLFIDDEKYPEEVKPAEAPATEEKKDA